MMQNIQIFYRGPVVFFVTCLCHAYLLAVALCSHCKTEFESNDDMNSSFFQGDFKTLKKKKKSFMAIFYGWGSTASRLLSHGDEAVCFSPLRS